MFARVAFILILVHVLQFWNWFSYICCSQGKFDETIKECTKAIELNPMYVKALLRRGEAHEKLQHYDESIAGNVQCQYACRVVQLRPSVIISYLLSAVC